MSNLKEIKNLNGSKSPTLDDEGLRELACAHAERSGFPWYEESDGPVPGGRCWILATKPESRDVDPSVYAIGFMFIDEDGVLHAAGGDVTINDSGAELKEPLFEFHDMPVDDMMCALEREYAMAMCGTSCDRCLRCEEVAPKGYESKTYVGPKQRGGLDHVLSLTFMIGPSLFLDMDKRPWQMLDSSPFGEGVTWLLELGDKEGRQSQGSSDTFVAVYLDEGGRVLVTVSSAPDCMGPDDILDIRPAGFLYTMPAIEMPGCRQGRLHKLRTFTDLEKAFEEAEFEYDMALKTRGTSGATRPPKAEPAVG